MKLKKINHQLKATRLARIFAIVGARKATRTQCHGFIVTNALNQYMVDVQDLKQKNHFYYQPIQGTFKISERLGFVIPKDVQVVQIRNTHQMVKIWYT